MPRPILAIALVTLASASLAQTGQSAGAQASHKVAANHPNTGKHPRIPHAPGTRRGAKTTNSVSTTGMGEPTTNSGMSSATTPQ